MRRRKSARSCLPLPWQGRRFDRSSSAILQLEAKAHITVQQWIDGGSLKGSALTEATPLPTAIKMKTAQ